MNYYTYDQNKPMNRENRRKNNIKTNKKISAKYSNEELEKVLKRELLNLINEPISETLKRERYTRLELLIKEYQKTKQEPIAVKAYNMQKEQVKNTSVYRKLNQPVKSINYKENTSITTKKAINAYQTQINYSRVNVNKNVVNSKKTSVKKQVKKKGFFEKIFEMFKSNKAKTVPKKVLAKPKVVEQTKKYTTIANTKDITQNVYNKFEQELRNFQNYTKSTGYQYYNKNGRKVKYEPRYL